MKKLLLILVILIAGCSSAKHLPFAPDKKHKTITRMTKAQKKRSLKGKKFKPTLIDFNRKKPDYKKRKK